MLQTITLRKGTEAAAVAVLVKFAFTNGKWIPSEIEEKDRRSDAEMDAYHAELAKSIDKPELGQIGRLRPGRVDTGKATLDNIQVAHAGMIRKGLVSIDYHLTELHKFYHQEKNKWFVVAAFNPVKPGSSVPKLSARARDALQKLAEMCWQYMHVWENPNGVVTVNFVGRMPDRKPLRALIVNREGALQVHEVGEISPEQEELEGKMTKARNEAFEQGVNPKASTTQQIAAQMVEREKTAAE